MRRGGLPSLARPESVKTLGGRCESRADRPSLLSPDPVEDDPILELIQQIQAGIRVEENFEKLFRRFRPLVQSFFLRKGFSSEESKDLTQDVFFRVFKGIDTFRGESRFERWLWEIADHIYLNELRRRKTEKRHGIEQSLDATTESDDGSNPAPEIPASDLSPEELVLHRQGLSALRAAFQKLPAQMRRCCILRYEKGLKYQEIAVVMKISIETVKAHLHQARKRLTARLGVERPDS
jgi:RNA polymerase sigma-70 factor (ECF subfamily)